MVRCSSFGVASYCSLLFLAVVSCCLMLVVCCSLYVRRRCVLLFAVRGLWFAVAVCGYCLLFNVVIDAVMRWLLL